MISCAANRFSEQEVLTMSDIIAIASGKGGVGKSTLTANLGLALFREGASVALVDGDTGLRSLDLILSMDSQGIYDLIDVSDGSCLLDQALLPVQGMQSFQLLPAAQFARTRDISAKRLHRILRTLKARFDFVLVDCPAGLEKGLRTVLSSGIDRLILVTSSDDISLRDAERLIQVAKEKDAPQPSLIINRIIPELVRRGEMLSASSAAAVLDVPLLGEIPEDICVTRSLLRHTFFLDLDCPARQAVLRIASRILGRDVPFPSLGSQKPSLIQRLFFPALKEVTPLDNH